MKVLVVDDDRISLLAVKSLLQDSCNCEVEEAISAEQALNLIYKTSLEWEPQWYDFVLVDIQMPAMNGDILTKVIRQTEENMRGVPIIATTSNATEEEIEAFKALGVTEVLLKPITKQKLDQVLKNHL